MDWILIALIEWLEGFAADRNHPLGFAVLLGSALLEYVFPPFPGDTVTLFGAVLITGYAWSAIGVFAAVLLGSLAGSMFNYWIGTKLRARPSKPESKRHAAMERLVAGFERHGPLYLVINRFLPGVRALFFVAAGLGGMPPRHVIAYGALSIALWNGVIIAIGAALGANLDALRAWFTRYTSIVWAVLAAALVIYVALRILARWRNNRRESRQ